MQNIRATNKGKNDNEILFCKTLSGIEFSDKINYPYVTDIIENYVIP